MQLSNLAIHFKSSGVSNPSVLIYQRAGLGGERRAGGLKAKSSGETKTVDVSSGECEGERDENWKGRTGGQADVMRGYS